eukprot:12904568-Prorocentrum_lima.AAC.1
MPDPVGGVVTGIAASSPLVGKALANVKIEEGKEGGVATGIATSSPPTEPKEDDIPIPFAESWIRP